LAKELGAIALPYFLKLNWGLQNSFATFLALD
jgi:hypothetical protein